MSNGQVGLGDLDANHSNQRRFSGRGLEAYKIGVIVDLPDYGELTESFPNAAQLAFDEAYARGVVERPVEVVLRPVRAQPWTDARPVIDTFRELVDEVGVLGVIGPMTSDNSLAILEHIERSGVPTCSICGSVRFVGKAAFSVANGGLDDEPYVMAAWLAERGYRRVAVIRETTQIGEEYSASFRRAISSLGIRVVSEASTYTVVSAPELEVHFAQLKAADPDALVYLGLGGLNHDSVMLKALAALDWDPPRIQTTAFVGATYKPELASRYEGWVGVDQYDERNMVFSAVLDRYERRFGYRPENSAASCGYDIGHAFAVGLGRMRIATPASLVEALETVRRLPACTGGPGTVITFGPEDHRGLKGPDFLLLRRCRAGKTEFEGTAAVLPWRQDTDVDQDASTEAEVEVS